MAVRTTITTPIKTIMETVEKNIDDLRAEYVTWLQYVGEICINDARLNGNYTDRTGNLRSSIGYVVVLDGKIIFRSAEKQYGGGSEGTKTVFEWLDKLAEENPTGLVLIIVAGMNYASFVEARNYNVTESAAELAEKLIPQLIGDIK